MTLKKAEPRPEHREFREAFLKVLDAHAGALPAVEMLALTAYAVGQIVALQDQREITPNQAMQLVLRNIEQGNADAIGNLMSKPAGRPN